MPESNHTHRAWLTAGIVVTALAGMRFNIALLAWVSWVPWLVVARRTRGWRASLWLLGAMQIGFFLQTVKIITDPIPWFFALMFSVPTALGGWALLWGFERLRARLGDAWGLALFPAVTVVGEWAVAHTSELGSWGALAYTQIDNLALMQVTSVFGLAGVSALVALVSALIAVLVDAPARGAWLRPAMAVAGLVVVAHGFGALRLATDLPGPSVTVATVTTDVHMGMSGLPGPEALRAGTDALFERTVAAARRGAQVVVWNEGATAIAAPDEAAFLARGAALAQAEGVDVLLAYVLPLDGMRRFENKYVWVGPEGPVETYHKHHPVPGEGATPRDAPLRAHDRPYGRAAGAICYDYDFPAVGAAHAALGAGVVFVPSSDWRGIDPFHTQMAAVRGIEGGYSVVRSVRWATSGAYDAHGVARGTASYFEGQRVMLAQVPTGRVETIYARLGPVLPLAAGLTLLAALGLAWSRGRRRVALGAPLLA